MILKTDRNISNYFQKLNGRILKANLGWSPTPPKSCQLIASLFGILPELNLTKLKLEYRYLKSGFKYTKRKM